VRERSVSFGLLLKRYRRRADLTQEELAERAGYSAAYIGKLERGARVPSSDAVQLLADALELDAPERAELDGARRVLLASAAARSDTGARGSADRPFVGRTHELAMIERHLIDGTPRLLAIAGEPGIGKTRLLQEARRRAQDAGITVLVGRCYRSAVREPYAPLIGALEAHLRVQTPERQREELRGCEWLGRLLPELGLEPAPRNLPPDQERRLMFRAVERFLDNVAGPRGMLLILDDLQWAGPDAIEMLASVVRSGRENSLRVCCAYRDTEVPPGGALAGALVDLAREDLACDTRLGPLEAAEAVDLFTLLVSQPGEAPVSLSEHEQDHIVRRAAGVPLFLVSLADAVQAGAPGGIPRDLAQSIRLRVSIPAEQAQEILRITAVAERRLPRRVLYVVSRLAEADVLAALDELLSAGLLIEERDAYRFSHDLIREMVESDMGAARVKALHGRIGTALEQLYPVATGEGATATPSSTDVPVDLLAYHFSRSERADKAILYLERAAESAQARQALANAESYYRELVDRLDKLSRPEHAIVAREKLARCLMAAAQYDEALQFLREATEISAVCGDVDAQMRVTAQMGLVHARTRTPQEGIELLRPVVALSEERAPSSAAAALYASLADLFFTANRYAEGLVVSERSVELARAAGDRQMLANAEIHRSTALLAMGRHEEGLDVLESVIPQAEFLGDLTSVFNAARSAVYVERGREYLERGLQVARRVGDPAQIAFMMAMCRQNAWITGDWERAWAYAEEAARLVEPLGESPVTAFSAVGVGLMRVLLGDTERGLDELREGLHIAERTRNLYSVLIGSWFLAEYYLVTGQPGEARDHLRRVFDRWGQAQCIAAFPNVEVAMAWALMDTGNEREAAALLEAARARAGADPPGTIESLWVSAKLAGRQGRWDEAESMFEKAVEIARGLPFPFAEGRALWAWGEMEAQRGDSAAARKRAEQALAIFRRLGDRLHEAPAAVFASSLSE